ncbi:TPA: GyrI-like domain-containing protein [Salmonella enterica subsp. enterica serovar Bovismorbificans]|nr:helix-turn-helix domain-containing protein [Salmonella enterica]HCT1199683.1 helix-turn-helix domain-containing protein [Salmonella enterica subsp. enterica serovar Bovismorbificans]EHJ3456253.1 helix-turn-helix domain-containing protein [Salmonella enterica]HDN5051981.1 helix-turn-helix domain-containing protein [Salmonella enterica subsp. enterica serovar Bovismorbificans]HDN5897772.1 helix-turn-helix domain-containing protein [Salmonella enterica subsp. enterica serovar Bovismorbificans]
MMMKKAIIISVLEQIEKNLEERIDIEKLVVITGYSRRSLQDFFKEKCGVSIGKYIRQRKLSRSATLLKLTSQSVTDIAFRMGFDSVQSYSREFKKTFGVNPNNYRKADFWDLRNLRPPYWLDCDEHYQFEICQLTSKEIFGFQTSHQIATNDLPKKASPIKWKIIHETLRTWGENVYCLSSFKPDNTKDQVIAVSSFFGMEHNSVDGGKIPMSRVIKCGKYAKFHFVGHKEQYQQFSNTIYMCILPKLNIIRREGEDIEYFHLASVQKQQNNESIVDLYYYIPVL